MEKKIKYIVAVFVAIILVVAIGATIYVNKKDIYVDDDGIEHWLVKNEEGNTILNEDGDILVYATDRKGKRQKDENGEYIMGTIDFPDVVINKTTVETPYFKMTMPKDWKVEDHGSYTLKDNENVTLKINNLGKVEADTVDAYYKETMDKTKDLLAALKANYPQTESKEDACVITLKNLDCRTFEFKVCEESGEVFLYSHSVIFLHKGQAYQITLRCQENSYKDLPEDFDLIPILDANFVVKDKVKE